MRQYYLLIGLILWSSCEQEFIPDVEQEQRIVVEGYVDAGEGALPPYVIISKSLPYFGTIETNDIASNQITDASVKVTHQGSEYELEQFCLSDLPPPLAEMILGGADVSFIPDSADFCLYIDWQSRIPVNRGDTYDLKIELSTGEEYLASTTTPTFVPIDSFEFTSPPGNPNADTLARLLCYINDPADQDNYYRYLTADEGGSFIAGFTSVTDDAFFNGQSFQFPLQKAEDPQSGEDIDPEIFGLYPRGDTVRIRWLSLDEQHFNFWNSFEFNLNNQGPFSTYTRVSSNIEGALGIWGGYSSEIYTLVVPEN